MEIVYTKNFDRAMRRKEKQQQRENIRRWQEEAKRGWFNEKLRIALGIK